MQVFNSTSTAKAVGNSIYPDDIYPVRSGYPNQVIPGFTAFDYMTVTSISGSIDVKSSSGEMPFALYASAKNINCSGSRDEGGSIKPYLMLEFAWTLRNSDGSIIDWWQHDLKMNSLGQLVNPYEQFRATEYMVPIRKDGSFTLELRVRAPGIEYKTTVPITVSKPSYGHEWYAAATNGGDDANDGKDHWGLPFTNGTYTESTGILEQTGAATNYDHDAATAGNPTDWFNWLYIDKAGIEGWYRIGEKLNNNQLRLQDKIGSDQTGVTTSSGPKLTFTGAARTAQANGGAGDPVLDRHNIAVHLDGDQGAKTWTFDEPYTFACGANNPTPGWGTVYKIIGGYNGNQVEIISGSGLDTDTSYLQTLLSIDCGGDGNIASHSSCHNLYLNGNNTGRYGLGGTPFDEIDNDDVRFLADRIKTDSHKDEAATINNSRDANAWRIHFWECDIDNRRNGYNVASGTATGGSSTTVEDSGASFPAFPSQRSVLVDKGGGNVLVGRLTSNTAQELTCSGGFEAGSGDPALNDGYKVAWRKSQGFLWAPGEKKTDCVLSFVGGSIRTDSDERLFDHYMYPTTKGDHVLLACIQMLDGFNVGFGINFNYDDNENQTTGNYYCIVDCFIQGSQWFTDSSGSANDPDTQGVIHNLRIDRNAGNVEAGFHQHASAAQFASYDNLHFGSGANEANREFHGCGLFGAATTTETPDRTDCDQIMCRNKVYSEAAGCKFEHIEPTTNNGRTEARDNEIHLTHASAVALIGNFDYLGKRVWKGNNFYLPNAVAAHFQTIGAGGNLTLASFNSAVGGDNISVNRQWSDPAAGVFLNAA